MNHVTAWVTVGGALILGAAAFYLQQLSTPTAKPRPAPIAQEAPARRSDTLLPATLDFVKRSNTAERLEALEAKLAEVRTPEQPPEVRPEMAPSAAEMEQQHAARIAQHGQERVDRAWAERTASALKEDFAREMGTANYSVESIDCRATLCNVTFSWPSRDDALSGWKKVLTKGTRVPCGREIIVPESAGTSGGRAEAAMLLDCSEWDGKFLF